MLLTTIPCGRVVYALNVQEENLSAPEMMAIKYLIRKQSRIFFDY